MKPDVKKFNVQLIEFDADEKIICEIRKHFFGFILIYITGVLIASIIAIASVLTGLWVRDSITSASSIALSGNLIMTVGLAVALVVLILTLVYAYIFGNNVVLLTTEKVAQILYKSLFDRKVSQLNISDVQDVTVTQVGIFARLYDYGTIVIETAGEQQNYTFSFAPNPHEHAKQIISARETNVKFFGN